MPAAALTLAVDRPERPERRRVPRETVVVSRATVRGLGDAPDDAVLIDLSIYGCRLSTATGHAPGAALWLRLDGGWPIAATVIWADGGVVGCRFDEPIPNATMRQFTRLSLVQSSRQKPSATS